MQKDFEQLATPLVINEKNWGNPISEDVQINQGNLDQEFLNQAEKYAWWAFLAEHAKAQANDIKSELDVLYAQLDCRTRSKANTPIEIKVPTTDPNAKEKKITASPIRYTEKMVENEVITDPDYQELLSKYNEIKKQAGIALAGMNAMLQRRDMLLQLGANYRAEGSADPIILKEAAKEKAIQMARENAAKRHAKEQEVISTRRIPGKSINQ